MSFTYMASGAKNVMPEMTCPGNPANEDWLGEDVEDLTLVLTDHGNMHGMTITGSRADLVNLAETILQGVKTYPEMP